MALCISGQALWASGILESLDDTTTPTGVVTSWLRSNLYLLNLSIGTEFTLSGSCIEPDFSTNESGIYCEFFYCNYYAKQANKNLGAESYSWIEIRGEDQGSIRKTSKTTVAQTYRTLSKDCKENLDKLLKWFNGEQATHASQVLYSDRFGGAAFGLLPPPSNYYSECNFVWNK